jgi:hypothetical protein
VASDDLQHWPVEGRMTENTRAIADHGNDDRPRRDGQEHTAPHPWVLLLLAGLAVMSLGALVSYHVWFAEYQPQSPLQLLYAEIYRVFGLAPALLFFLLLVVWASIWWWTGRADRPWLRMGWLCAVPVTLGIFFATGYASADGTPTPAHIGTLGLYLASALVTGFGYWIALILSFVAALGAAVLATDFFFVEQFEGIRRTRGRPLGGDGDGVEAAVTEHLRGLASADPREPRAAVATSAAAPAVAGVPVARDAAAHDRDETAAADEIEPDAAGTAIARSRRSWFERRHEQVAGQPAAAAPGDEPAPVESWLPPASEAQEIDNPETKAEAVDAEGVEGEELAALGACELAPPAAAGSVPAAAELPEAMLASELFDEVGDALAAGAGATAADLEDSEYSEDSEDLLETELFDEYDEVIVPDASDVDEPPAPAAAPVAARADLVAIDEEEVEGEADAAAVADAADEPLAPPAATAATAAAAAEPLVTIPRPEVDVRPPLPTPPAFSRASRGTRQQDLFPSAVDEALIAEAKAIVIATRRVSATQLRRRLRIGYDEAREVLAVLSARGIVELDDDSSQGRLIT